MTSSLTHYAIEAAALSVSEIHFNSRCFSVWTLGNQPIAVAVALQRSPTRADHADVGTGAWQGRDGAPNPGLKSALFEKVP
jgi:hypothetical protein